MYRLVLRLEQQLLVKPTKETKEVRWSEYTPTDHLPRLEEGQSSNEGGFVYDLSKGRFGFQEVSDDDCNNLSHAIMSYQEDMSRTDETQKDNRMYREMSGEESPESTQQVQVSRQQRISHTLDLDQPSDEEDQLGEESQEASGFCGSQSKRHCKRISIYSNRVHTCI